ncbi:phosphodiester glycosidase family protein [Paenibacillus sp. GCM10027626]|uniref:phosphodiester glycosidase family protein n=1 Tax=Paenibacillus sp. GCM10027626 TaxID=3273411 RepID=UPI003643C359
MTPSGTNLRYLMADTIITTKHREWAKYVIGKAELDKRVAEYNKRFDDMGVERDTHTITMPPVPDKADEQKPLIEVEEISGKGSQGFGYKGFVLTVNDPTKLRLGVPAKRGRGERVRDMAERTGAIAAVNGGGFADPNWNGNGFQPIGVVISQGKVFYNDLGKKSSTNIVGIDKDGKMIAGRYTMQEMLDMNIQEAVTFQPRIIVNGKGLIKNAGDGWGIAPRTAMGQREDGAILFVIIDGRDATHSVGVNLFDVQNILLERGAVIAANLDGGSSTILVKDNVIMNKPSTKSGEGRYLPTAWLVFEHPEQAEIKNIWEGLRPQDIDASTW